MNPQIDNGDIWHLFENIFNTHQTTGEYRMRFWHLSHQTYTESDKALHHERVWVTTD